MMLRKCRKLATIPSMMTGQAIMTLPMSRPKVHRPPVFRDQERNRRSFGMVLVVSFAVLLIASWMSSQKPTFTEMKAEIEPVQRVESSQSAAAKSSDTIVIKEGNQTIFGQMARIPIQNKATPEIQTVTALDKEDGKELLSIVNKY